MNYIGESFKVMGRLLAILLILCIIFVPLGAWKAIEIGIWVWNNVSITIK